MPIHAVPNGVVETFEWGEGPELVLLLHAAAAGPRSLAGLAQALHAPGRRIVAPALHLYGRTAMRAAADPLAAHVAAAEACLRLYPASRRILFGHSMGGLVALRAAAAGAPVASLVLYDPIAMFCLNPEQAEDAALLAWDRTILARLEQAISGGTPEAGVAAFVTAWNEVEWNDLPAAQRGRLIAGAATLAAETRAVSFHVPELGPIRAITAESLLLRGAASPAITRRIIARLSDLLPNARQAEVPGCGHMGPVQAPETVAALTGL